MMEMLSEYGGLMGEMSRLLTPQSPAHHGPLFTSFIAGDWYRGHTILIGDAAHTTPPHLASGAGIAIEDAIVLARCLRQCGEVAPAFEQFMHQRYERCRMVIENSRTLSRWDRESSVPPAAGGCTGRAELRGARASDLTIETRLRESWCSRGP